jgi:NAD+ kinase
VQSPRVVARAAVVTHGRREAIGDGLERLRRVAEASSVELLLSEGEREKHGLAGSTAPSSAAETADLVVVLGGDGTMLRALARLLGTPVPVIGVNFGRVGFLSSISADGLEEGIARAFAGEYEVAELPTLDVDCLGGRYSALNDVVARSSDLGRLVEVEWLFGGEALGRQACDGIICATPVGSTAYNLSVGGPVLVWGLEAMVAAFVAPHSLHARPLVLPSGRELTLVNRTSNVDMSVVVDGDPVDEVPPGGEVRVRLDERRSLLASLPEMTFFRRYHEAFGTDRLA